MSKLLFAKPPIIEICLYLSHKKAECTEAVGTTFILNKVKLPTASNSRKSEKKTSFLRTGNRSGHFGVN